MVKCRFDKLLYVSKELLWKEFCSLLRALPVEWNGQWHHGISNTRRYADFQIEFKSHLEKHSIRNESVFIESANKMNDKHDGIIKSKSLKNRTIYGRIKNAVVFSI